MPGGEGSTCDDDQVEVLGDDPVGWVVKVVDH